MNILRDILDFLEKTFKFWVVVLPWETGLRVTWGKKIKLLVPGTYFKIPIMHTVHVHTTRLRFTNSPVQTLTTTDNITVTLSCNLGYAIKDIQNLYMKVQSPECSLIAICIGFIADYVTTHTINDCKPNLLSKNVLDSILKENLGLEEVQVNITSFAVVKTFRLIQDHMWSMGESKENSLL